MTAPARARLYARVLGSALAAGAVGWAVLRALEGADGASSRLAAIDLRWLGLSALAWTSSLAAQGARWRVLLPTSGQAGSRPSTLDLARLVIGANVVGAALPGPAGELSAALVVSERGIPFAAAFGSAVLGRVVALGVIGACTLGFGAVLYGELPPDARAVVALPTVLLAAGGLSAPLVVRFLVPLTDAVGRLLAPLLPRAAERLTAGRQRVRDAIEALASLPTRAWAAAVMWSLVSLAVQSVAIRLAFGAAGTWPDWQVTAFMHLLMSLAAIAGIVLPAGGLAVDGLFVAIFPAVAGVDVGTAVLAAVAVRWMRVLVLLAGVPALGGMFERLVALASRANERAPAA